MNAIVPKNKTFEDLTKNIPPSSGRFYKVGEDFRAYSKSKKEWIGALSVAKGDGRIMTVNNETDAICKTCKAYQAKPFYKDSPLNFHVSKSNSAKYTFSKSIFVTEIVEWFTPKSKLISDAMQNEIHFLADVKTWGVVNISSLPKIFLILKGRFVLAIKDFET